MTSSSRKPVDYLQDQNGVIDLRADRLDYTLRRYYIDAFHFKHIQALRPGSSVLDLGGNKILKRGQFDIEKYGLRVVYSNLSTIKDPDVQADAMFVPFENNSFDAVICSELLEHVPTPPSVLSEIYRVLRPGGILFICVPFLYQIHGDPYDFGRYTDHYWAFTLAKTGFQNIVIEKQGLFWSVLVDTIRAWLYELNARKHLQLRYLAIQFIARAKKLAVKWDRGASSGMIHFMQVLQQGLESAQISDDQFRSTRRNKWSSCPPIFLK